SKLRGLGSVTLYEGRHQMKRTSKTSEQRSSNRKSVKSSSKNILQHCQLCESAILPRLRKRFASGSVQVSKLSQVVFFISTKRSGKKSMSLNGDFATGTILITFLNGLTVMPMIRFSNAISSST